MSLHIILYITWLFVVPLVTAILLGRIAYRDGSMLFFAILKGMFAGFVAHIICVVMFAVLVVAHKNHMFF